MGKVGDVEFATDALGTQCYAKSPAIYRMLFHLMGEGPFVAAVRGLVAAHAHATFGPLQLAGLLQGASGSSLPGRLLLDWHEATGILVLLVSGSLDRSSLIRVTQRRFDSAAPGLLDAAKGPLPMLLELQFSRSVPATSHLDRLHMTTYEQPASDLPVIHEVSAAEMDTSLADVMRLGSALRGGLWDYGAVVFGDCASVDVSLGAATPAAPPLDWLIADVEKRTLSRILYEPPFYRGAVKVPLLPLSHFPRTGG